METRQEVLAPKSPRPVTESILLKANDSPEVVKLSRPARVMFQILANSVLIGLPMSTIEHALNQRRTTYLSGKPMGGIWSTGFSNSSYFLRMAGHSCLASGQKTFFTINTAALHKKVVGEHGVEFMEREPFEEAAALSRRKFFIASGLLSLSMGMIEARITGPSVGTFTMASNGQTPVFHTVMDMIRFNPGGDTRTTKAAIHQFAFIKAIEFSERLKKHFPEKKYGPTAVVVSSFGCGGLSALVGTTCDNTYAFQLMHVNQISPGRYATPSFLSALSQVYRLGGVTALFRTLTANTIKGQIVCGVAVSVNKQFDKWEKKGFPRIFGLFRSRQSELPKVASKQIEPAAPGTSKPNRP